MGDILNYKDKFNKERLKLSLILKDKNEFSKFKMKAFIELLFTINMIEEGTFTRLEILNFVQEKTTSNGHSFWQYLILFNFMNTLEFVFENYKKITLDSFFLQKLNKMIFEKMDIEAGQYRKARINSPLKIKRVETKDILSEMKEFDDFLNKKGEDTLSFAFEAHYKFLTISPFKKGNFYIAFLLLTLICLKNGYLPIVLRSIDKKRYFEVMENYQLKNKKEAYYSFMRSALSRSFQLLAEKSFNEENKDNLLTIAKFAKLCDVPVSTIRYWMKEGHIKPALFTPSGYALFDETQKIDIQEAKLTKMISKCMSSLKKGIEKASGQS